MLNITLADVMCDHPIRVRESTPIGNVAHLLFRYQINGILVVADQDEQRLIGVFTTTDLLRLMDESIESGTQRIDELKKIGERPVGGHATREVVTLQKSDKLVKAVAMMHRKGVHTIPVFDGEKLVGVIGRHDILNVAFS